MKILIEGSPMYGPRTGVGQYVTRLLEALFKLDSKDQYTVFGFLFFGNSLREQSLPTGVNVEYKFIRFLPGKIFNRLKKHFLAPPVDLLLGKEFDIAIFTNFIRLPLAVSDKSITIVYDLSFINAGEYAEDKNRRALTKNVRSSVRKSSHIITISQSAKKEIVNFYKVDPSLVSIVYPAVDHAVYYPRSSKEIDRVKNKLKITSKYILYTGTLEPRKNIEGIIDAYCQLPQDVREEYALVLAGGKGWKDESIHHRLSTACSDPINNIIVTGYVDDEDLPPLYTGASVFVFPSFYEGFGMPPLEAMACGTPVITSDNSSLPEVVGNSGITIDANDTPGLTRYIINVLKDKNTANDMKRAGIKQAKRFNWENSARSLKNIIEETSEG